MVSRIIEIEGSPSHIAVQQSWYSLIFFTVLFSQNTADAKGSIPTIPAAPTFTPISPSSLPMTPFSAEKDYKQAQNYPQHPPQQLQQPPPYKPQVYQPPPRMDAKPQGNSPPTPVVTGYGGQQGGAQGRVKDAIEFAAFAISALKVRNSLKLSLSSCQNDCSND